MISTSGPTIAIVITDYFEMNECILPINIWLLTIQYTRPKELSDLIT